MQLWLFLLLLNFSYTFSEDPDLDKLIEEIFRKPEPGTTASSNPQPKDNRNVPGVDDCVCVPHYLCNDGSVNTNGEGIIDIR